MYNLSPTTSILRKESPMDYTKLLFSLEIRKLAIQMFKADGNNFPDHTEKYEAYVKKALQEATFTIELIEK
jgi:hypothetical protein